MRNLIIIGGGYAGLWAAMGAANALERFGQGSEIQITLINRDPYLTQRVRLYEQGASAMRIPLDQVLAPIGVKRVEGSVTAIDTQAKTVAVGDRIFPYDRLIFAAGSQLHRPDVPGLKEYAFNVDNYADAVRLEQHLASVQNHTAVVVGAGFTGLEVATELAARLRTVAGQAGKPKVILVEQAPQVAPDLGDHARPVIAEALRATGVEVRAGTTVTRITPEGVTLATGEIIPAATTIWTVGLRANPLTQHLPVDRDPMGRVPVDTALHVQGLEGVLAAGDVALALTDGVHPALMSCQHAMPQGAVAGHNAIRGLLGEPLVNYRQPRYVTCLDLGEWGGLFTEGWSRTVIHTGGKGKALKRVVNEYATCPPLTGNRKAILKAGDPDFVLRNYQEKGALVRWIERQISPRIVLSFLRLLTACSAAFRTPKIWSRKPTSAGQSPA